MPITLDRLNQIIPTTTPASTGNTSGFTVDRLNSIISNKQTPGPTPTPTPSVSATPLVTKPVTSIAPQAKPTTQPFLSPLKSNIPTYKDMYGNDVNVNNPIQPSKVTDAKLEAKPVEKEKDIWGKLKEIAEGLTGGYFEQAYNKIVDPTGEKKRISDISNAQNAVSVLKVAGQPLVENRVKEIAKQQDIPYEEARKGIEAIAVKNNQSVYDVVGLSINKLAEPGGNPFRNSLFEDVSRELGIRADPTNSEVVNTLMTLSIAGGLVKAPLTTIKALGYFSGVNEVKSGLISAIKGEGFKFGDGYTLADLYSGDNHGTKVLLDTIDFFGTGAATGLLFRAEPKIAQKFTKDFITKYDLPKTVEFTPEMAKEIVRGRNVNTPEAEAFTKAGLNSKEIKTLMQEGGTVTLPSEKLTYMVDKPYWSKIKEIFNKVSEPTLVSSEMTGLKVKPGVKDKPLQLGEGKDPTVKKAEDYIKNKGVKFRENTSTKQPVNNESKTLVATHNLTEDNLLHADKMGGLALPSIGISNKNFPLTNFGEISLIADKSLYDPKIKSNKAYNADAYTPRYPSVEYSYVTESAKKHLLPLIEKARDFYKDNVVVIPKYIDSYGSPEKAILDSGDFNRNGIKTLERSGVLEGYFAISKGANPEAGYDQIYDIIKNNKTEYQSFIKDLYNKIAGDEKMFKGYTPSGNRRYIAHSLENVVSEMKKSMKEDEGENFNYGLGTLRSKIAKKYGSVQEIKNDRNKVVTPGVFEKIKEELDTEFNEILEDGVSNSKLDTWGEYERFVNVLMDGIKANDLAGTFEKYSYKKGIDIDRIEKFLLKLIDAPTEYFEVKPQRAVGIDEFKAAVVPDNISEKALKVLTDKGIEVVKYPQGNDQARSEIVKRLSDEKGLAFRIKDDLAKAGFKITDAQEQQIIDFNKRVFGDEDVKITTQILANKNALGKYEKGMIEIVDGKADPKDTYYHEVVHKYLDTMTTMQEQTNILLEASKLYKTDDFNKVEEQLAEDFINYAKSREGFTGRLKAFIDKVLIKIKEFLKFKTEVDKLYNDIVSGKKVTEKGPEAKTVSTILEGPAKISGTELRPAQKPVGTGKLKKSKAYTRIVDRLTEETRMDVSYNAMDRDLTVEQSIQFIKDNPQKALRIAFGLEEAPAGYKDVAINIALANKALDMGNPGLASQLEASRSLRQTAKGQDIYLERGRFTDDSPFHYFKELLDRRLTNLGSTYRENVVDAFKADQLKASDTLNTPKAKAMSKIKADASRLKARVQAERVKNEIKSAQDFIDSLIC